MQIQATVKTAIAWPMVEQLPRKYVFITVNSSSKQMVGQINFKFLLTIGKNGFEYPPTHESVNNSSKARC